MSSLSAPTSVYALLRRYVRQRHRIAAASLALLATATATVTATAAVLLDAAVALSPTGLLLADTLILAPLTLLLLAAAWHLRPQSLQATTIAAELERRLHLPGNPLMHAVELSGPAAVGSAVLRHEAVRRGEALAQRLDPRSALDAAPLRRALWIAGGCGGVSGVALLTAQLLWPGAVGASVLRLSQPFALHPPYSGLVFDIGIEPAPVPYGESASILAGLSTRDGSDPPERATLVWLNDRGHAMQRSVMSRVSVGHRGTATEVAAPTASSHASFSVRVGPVVRDMRFYVQTPTGRSGITRLMVDSAPRIVAGEAMIRPPAYTGQPPRSTPLTPHPAPLTAVVGSNVTLTLKSSTPLSSSTTARWAAGEHPRSVKRDATPADSTVPVVRNPADSRVAQVQVPVARSGRIVVVPTGVDGKPGPTWTLAVEAMADRPPRVRIVQPAAMAVVVEGWPVPVTVEADDDHGVAQLTLTYRSERAATATDQSLELRNLPAERATATTTLDLSAMGLTAGDTLQLWAKTRDTSPSPPDHGNGEATSAVHTLRVVSKDQYQTLMRSLQTPADVARAWDAARAELEQLRAQRERLLARLAAVTDSATDARASDAQRVARADAAAAAEAYAAAANRLAQRFDEAAGVDPLYEFERPWAAMMRERAAALRRQAGLAGRVSTSLSDAAGDAANLQRIADAAAALAGAEQPWRDESHAQLEQAVADLQRLRLTDAMAAAVQTLAATIPQQRLVASGMAAADSDPLDHDATRETADAQAAVRDATEAAVRALRSAADAGRETLPTMSGSVDALAAAVGAGDVLRDQHRAEAAARNADIEAAIAAATRAAATLESLQQQADTASAAATSSLSNDRPLGLTAPQLRQAMQQMQQSRTTPPASPAASAHATGTGRIQMLGPRDNNPFSDHTQSTRGGPNDAQATGDRAVSDGDTPAEPAERITTDGSQTTHTITPPGVSIPGVPIQYQDDAAHYFRRLADDSR